MRLIYIYGPPGVGKLTTARALSAITGFRVFHNHLSIDCVQSVFDFGTDPFWRQVHLLRQNVLEEAARQGVDLCYTGVFEYPKDIEIVTRRLEGVERNGGTVCPVQLTCSIETLESRIPSAERAARNKVVHLEVLHRYMAESDVFRRIPDRESLVIDNTDVPAEKVAASIATHYHLPVQGNR